MTDEELSHESDDELQRRLEAAWKEDHDHHRQQDILRSGVEEARRIAEKYRDLYVECLTEMSASDHVDELPWRKKGALRHESDALRDGQPKAADLIAVFEELQPLVAGLIRKMKRARREEGGLYCGGCGANIADNAQGVQALRDRIAELEAEAAKPKTAECVRCKVDSGPVDAAGLCTFCQPDVPF